MRRHHFLQPFRLTAILASPTNHLRSYIPSTPAAAIPSSVSLSYPRTPSSASQRPIGLPLASPHPLGPSYPRLPLCNCGRAPSRWSLWHISFRRAGLRARGSRHGEKPRARRPALRIYGDTATRARLAAPAGLGVGLGGLRGFLPPHFTRFGHQFAENTRFGLECPMCSPIGVLRLVGVARHQREWWRPEKRRVSTIPAGRFGERHSILCGTLLAILMSSVPLELAV